MECGGGRLKLYGSYWHGTDGRRDFLDEVGGKGGEE